MIDLEITVLKTLSTRDVFGEERAEELGAELNNMCSRMKQGTAFTVRHGTIPKHFCTGMWNSIYPLVLTLEMGGNFPWSKEEGTIVASCPDGMRPVIVKIERVKE